MATTGVFTGSSNFSADFQNVITRATAIASLPINLLNSDKSNLTSQADALTGIDGKFKTLQNAVQGIADSLVYQSSDSTLYFYRDPVLWSDENQMTADSIHMLLKNRNISRIYMVSNSFVVSQDSLLDFNQIKGRKMTTYFENKAIHHVIVQGNGESIYHALEEKKVKKDSLLLKITFLAGMNKIICSNMRIDFKAGKVSSINFYVKPDASFFPPQNIKEEDRKLKGFSWRGSDRPKRKDVVKRGPIEIRKAEPTVVPNK